MCLRLTAPQLLGMVKTEEPLDSDVISNIQWECEKIEIIGREMAFKSAWRDCHSEVLTSFILLGDGIASLHANQSKILKTGPGLSIMTFSKMKNK